MGLTQIYLLAVYSIAVILIVALTYVSGDDIILQNKSEGNSLDTDRFLPDVRLSKRPFCNAFAGCGRKRSAEPMGALIELNSEPAVDELNRQILSGAKLWEAIQAARAEADKERYERRPLTPRNYPLALAFSDYRRKRAATAFDQIRPNQGQYNVR